MHQSNNVCSFTNLGNSKTVNKFSLSEKNSPVSPANALLARAFSNVKAFSEVTKKGHVFNALLGPKAIINCKHFGPAV